jgi:hypothetical protein
MWEGRCSDRCQPKTISRSAAKARPSRCQAPWGSGATPHKPAAATNRAARRQQGAHPEPLHAAAPWTGPDTPEPGVSSCRGSTTWDPCPDLIHPILESNPPPNTNERAAAPAGALRGLSSGAPCNTSHPTRRRRALKHFNCPYELIKTTTIWYLICF